MFIGLNCPAGRVAEKVRSPCRRHLSHASPLSQQCRSRSTTRWQRKRGRSKQKESEKTPRLVGDRPLGRRPAWPSLPAGLVASSKSMAEAEEILAASTGELIPGLPNDVAACVLASLPISHHARLRATSRAWRALLSTPPPLLAAARLRRPRDLLCFFPQDPSLVPPYLFDPSTIAWLPLPTAPCSAHAYGLSNFVPLAVGPRLYVLGGSHFDARAYPVDRPVPSAASHCLDLSQCSTSAVAWTRLPDMLCPRGSFACAAVTGDGRGDQIIVAGGGSRHSMFPSDGSRVSSVERYDAGRGEWKVEAAMPRERAGCVGWIHRREPQGEDEFWVMGGYGGYRTLGGVFPADVYYRDGVVMGLRSKKWRAIGDMWHGGERRKLGRVVVVDGENGDASAVFMLDQYQNDIFRYDMQSNCWLKESTLRRRILGGESFGFVAIDGELHVLTSTMPPSNKVDFRRLPKKKATVEIQAYDPRKRKWRYLTIAAPFCSTTGFNVAALCTVRL